MPHCVGGPTYSEGDERGLMLRLITAWSSETLADWLAEWYSMSAVDPFQRELVVVPTPGMERYVTRRLARRLGVSDPLAEDGVCAAVDFVQPQDLMASVLAGAADDGHDPWVPAALQWYCVRAIDELVERRDDRLTGLRHHLRADTRDVRRMGVARDVANLLDNYASQRPDLLLEWAEGNTAQTPSQYLWQADVFRHVLQQTGTPPWPLRVRELLAGGIGDVDIPARLAVFGVTRYGVLEQQFLEALARDREVAVLMVEHSPGHADTRHGVTGGNHLVDALGREELTALRALESMRPEWERLPGYPESVGTLLSRLQVSIARDEPLAAGPPAAGDDSLTVHGCAGALRQVEVLRDQILGLLQKDESLQARDVLVMCTDLDRYAPLIGQVFGTTEAPIGGPTRDLRVSVADRSTRLDNPVLQVVQAFVGLLAARMTAAEVLDLVEQPAVADRFGLDAQAHSRIERLVTDAGVRWGLSREHRATFGVDAGAANTWEVGMDRLATGVAVDGRDAELIRGVAPIEASAESDVSLVAALDQVVATLQGAWRFARSSHPARDWATAITEWIEPLVGGEAQWRLAAAMSVVSRSLDGDAHVRLGEVAALLDAELARYGPRPRLLAGGVDVVAMRPMRNVPFRVVCLLGMDDGAFPRSLTLEGDDLLAVDPRPGERDPRAEDRQLLLDAVCAAQQHLVITYSSRNPVSGDSLPPAAPLAELLDSIGDVVQHHPLVAHDPRNFTRDPQRGVAVSFDRAAAAVASADTPVPDPPRDARVAAVSADMTLDDLVAFWRNPAKAFLRSLDLAVDRDEDAQDLELMIELNNLEKWKLGDDLLTSGRALDQARQLAVARGVLPVARPEGVWDEVAAKVARIRANAVEIGYDTDAAHEYTHLDLPLDPRSGTVLTGVLRHPVHGPLIELSFSDRKASHVLALRIRVAALCAAGIPTAGALVHAGRARGGIHHEGAWGQSDAATWLRTLAYLRQVGLSRPLPFAPRTSEAYGSRLPDVEGALAAAQEKWTGGYDRPGESNGPEYRMLWDSDWRTLTSIPPLVGRWLPTHDSLFAQLAGLVFGDRS